MAQIRSGSPPRAASKDPAMSLRSSIRNALRPASYENDIREELDSHLEMDRRNGHARRSLRIEPRDALSEQ
jgi:hypothetical protein